MKKYFAIMVAVLFVFCVFGMSYAQNTSVEKAKPAAEPSAPKAGQQMTPEKKKASEAPSAADAKPVPDKKKPVKKSEKSKKRQAETPEKQKAKEDAAKTGAVKGN